MSKGRPKSIKPEENIIHQLPETNTISGLGDVVKSITNFLGIETCEACEKRRQELNKWFPFLGQANEVNDEEIEFIKHLKTLKQIESDVARKMLALYNKTFNSRVEYCSCPTVFIECINKLYNLYLVKYAPDNELA